MNLKSLLAGVAVTAALTTAAPVMAQDYSQEPTFGYLRLVSGFVPDPIGFPVASGGEIDAEAAIGGECVGYISNAPDFRFQYQAGDYPLIISALSEADITLVINTPDGSWTCNDDRDGSSLNPAVWIENPTSGQYDVWIGTWGSTSIEPATLYISEIEAP